MAIPDAIKLSSWDDMCVENGGITLVIMLMILTFFLVAWYLLSAGEAAKTDTSPLYDHDRPNQSAFRRLMVGIERIFVLPFTPAGLDSYVMWIFMLYFIVTIPMGVTRYYEQKWALNLIALQGPLNMIAHYVFGCKTLGIEAIPYTEPVLVEAAPRYPVPPKSEKWGRIDWFFTFHLTFGMLWLILGFIQIYKARNGAWSPTPATNWKAHRIFGRVAFLVLFVHIILISATAYENPTNQHLIIRFGYLEVISLELIRGTWKGIKNAYHAARSVGDERAKYVQKHRMHMFFVFVWSIMGSGTIRIAAWGLWFVGHFLSPETRMLIDRGTCQKYAEQGIGDATDCWKPVFLSYMCTDVMAFWLELLFITMPRNKKYLAAERRNKRVQFEQGVIVLFPTILLVLADPHIERWVESSSLPYFLVFILANIAEFSAFLWYVVVHFTALISDWLHDDMNDPLDQSFMGKIKGCLKSLYLLDHEADDEHVKED